MSSSMAPASIASNLSTYSQGKTLSPLAWSDDKILETVYITHVHTGERYDVESLFSLTSNILRRSTAIADSVASKTGTPTVGLIEDKVPLSGYEPPFRKLKQISSQMMSTPLGEHHAHLTTMSILEQLKSHTWDGKAIFALAAFSLEYGNFWHLVQTPSGDSLGRSLATMNRVHGVEKNRQAIADYNSLVKNLLFAVECITELERLSTKGYDNKDVPALSDAMQEIPVAVYWAIITAIICANHLDLLVGDS
ncbi:hypothetical protein L195_g041149 [Trifolium pratense]|uniref:Sieve element occlusion N-terminal domain-containing protein n=5 Tax=Trifolium TaxID=3898 RepID=A0A2K3M2V0_TRIPR|nr:hypothetical protein L195_g041149 [Trifolium pratense]